MKGRTGAARRVMVRSELAWNLHGLWAFLVAMIAMVFVPVLLAVWLSCIDAALASSAFGFAFGMALMGYRRWLGRKWGLITSHELAREYSPDSRDYRGEEGEGGSSGCRLAVLHLEGSEAEWHVVTIEGDQTGPGVAQQVGRMLGLDPKALSLFGEEDLAVFLADAEAARRRLEDVVEKAWNAGRGSGREEMEG